ncbi:MAG: LuxR C-terminal-related transcriptional regulator [Myxococcota bacterium]
MADVASCNIENLLAAADRAGFAPASVLAGTGLRPAELPRRVPWADYAAALDNVVRIAGGLDAACAAVGTLHLSPSALDILFSSRFSPTALLKTACQLAERAWRNLRVTAESTGPERLLLKVEIPAPHVGCLAFFHLSRSSLAQLTARAGLPPTQVTLLEATERMARFDLLASRNPRARDPVEDRADRAAEGWGLTPTEVLVLVEMLRGRANKEISAELGMAEGTVEVHLTRIFRKSGIQGRASLISRLLGPEW